MRPLLTVSFRDEERLTLGAAAKAGCTPTAVMLLLVCRAYKWESALPVRERPQRKVSSGVLATNLITVKGEIG